jgi:hypothetical protein
MALQYVLQAFCSLLEENGEPHEVSSRGWYRRMDPAAKWGLARQKVEWIPSSPLLSAITQ